MYRWVTQRVSSRSFFATLVDSRMGRHVTGRLRVASQHGVVILVRRTVQDFVADDCPHLAAAISYYSLFSLFPLLLGLIAVLGFAVGSATVQGEVTDWVAGFLPQSGELISANVSRVVKAREEAGVLAVLGFLWSATAVFGTIRKGLNAAWDVERARPLLQQKLLDLAMVGGVGALFVLSTLLTATQRLLRQWQLPLPGIDVLGHESLIAVGGTVLAAALTYLVFLLLYKTVPNTDVAWRSAALGATLATILFEVAMTVFVWYAQAFGRYELVYGSLGAAIGLLTWVYLSALILLLGAELGAEHGKIVRAGKHPPISVTPNQKNAQIGS